ncbi:variable surface lipoprotein [Metamycoplasma hominis]|uniref:variable surface lipoprotein n=2 Tax=Metamycoplasma hominis TaxID=2098 RepID=UPI001C37B604|nr:variable surface lipoprotein [Metamycoplasma hominis]
MKKSKKILLTMGVVLPLLASTPLVAAGCVETKKPEVKPEGEKPGTTPEKKPEGEKPGTTPEVKPEGETTIENIIKNHNEIKDDELNKTKSLLNELNKEIEKREIEKREIEKREEQNLLEKRNNLIKETEAKWDDITKKIDEYSKDATISKFPEFTQITDYLKYKNVELKNLKATKNNTIKLLVAKYFNILEAKILVENIIKNHNEIKDDELNKTKSLLNELNKEIEKREEQNLLEKRNNLIKETEAKWDDITKKIDEYSKDATISKFPEFTQITDYLKYKNVELKNLKATKNNTIKLLVAKYFNILEAKILVENIIKNHNEIKDDELNKTKSLLNELNKEIEKREEQNLLEKRNNLIKETEAKWDDITKKIEEYSKDATISKFPEFTQITDYLKYKNVELKNLKATKNNTIKLLVAKYFNILEAKILVENIIKNHNEIKDDELNKTKSLLNELNKEIEKREIEKREVEKREEQNLLEKRNNLIKETEAKWDDITKKIDEYSKDATISKFPEFTQITDYLKYKNVELKNLKATKNNTIKLLVAKYFNILEAKILVENIIKNHNEIKDDELNKTKSLLNELNKEIEKNQALSEAKKQLDSALKHAKKLNIGSLDFNKKFNFNKEFNNEYARALEAIKDNDLNAIKEITFELNSLINLTTSQKSKTTSEIKNDVEGEVHELNDLIAKLNDFVSNYVEETFNDIDEAGLISSIDNWIDMVEGFIKESKNPSKSLYFKLEYLKSQTKIFYEQKMESWANKVSDLLIEKGYDLLDKIANMKMVKNLAGYQKELEDCLNEFAELDETITVEKQFELSKKLYDLIPKIQKELDNEHNKTLNNELN